MTGGQYKSRLRLLKYNAAKAATLQAPAIQNTILQTDTVLQQEFTKEADERMFRDAIGECISQASVLSDEREEACRFWRGGCTDEIDYSSWDQDCPSPVTSPPSRAHSPGILSFLPKPRRTGRVLKTGPGLRALRALMPKWSDKDQADTLHNCFYETARRSGLEK